jgi:hypothetical protein
MKRICIKVNQQKKFEIQSNLKAFHKGHKNKQSKPHKNLFQTLNLKQNKAKPIKTQILIKKKILHY